MFPPEISVEGLNELCKDSMISYLGIEFTEVGADYLMAKMPVDHRTRQPLGLLHGGANVVLAETMGSLGSTILLDIGKQHAVGLEINANHISSIRDGFVYGMARPIHIGNKTHIWEIKIEKEEGRLVSICRLTMAILDNK